MQTLRSSSDPSFNGPLRVLFVNDTTESGGRGRSFHTILKFLDPRVIHRTVVLARRGPASERLEQARVADEVIIEVGFRRLARLAKRGGYDLIYCNGTSAAFAGGILSAATSLPALWHVRYTSIPS